MDLTLFTNLSCCSVLIPTAIALTLVILISLKFILPKGKVGDFHKKYVFITGCDSGFGRTTAVRLDQMGFHVFGACLTQEGKELLELACSPRLVALIMDVTKHEQIKKAYEDVKRSLPPNTGLWALDNNAGYMSLGPLEWFKMEEYRTMAEVNLWGLIDVTKTFLPLIKQAKGRVVNVSSVAGVVAPALRAPYSVCKYGVEAFSDALRREMAPWGIRVSIIQPQPFQTPLWAGMAQRKLKALWEALDREMQEEYGVEFKEQVAKGLDTNYQRASPHTHMVVDDVIDAITSRDPQLRYRVGSITKIFTILASLPTGVLDKVYQIRSPNPIPQAAK